jgi:hypothetical protein
MEPIWSIPPSTVQDAPVTYDAAAEHRKVSTEAISRTSAVGFQKSTTYAEQQLYAARSYLLIKPPRIGRRVIRSSLRSAMGWVGRGG